MKTARTNFALLATERSKNAAADYQLQVDDEESALASTVANALQQLGRPPVTIQTLVRTTESRMQTLSETASAWTTCVNESGGIDSGGANACSAEQTAFAAASRQITPLWAAWASRL